MQENTLIVMNLRQNQCDRLGASDIYESMHGMFVSSEFKHTELSYNKNPVY